MHRLAIQYIIVKYFYPFFAMAEWIDGRMADAVRIKNADRNPQDHIGGPADFWCMFEVCVWLCF